MKICEKILLLFKSFIPRHQFKEFCYCFFISEFSYYLLMFIFFSVKAFRSIASKTNEIQSNYIMEIYALKSSKQR